MVLNLKQLDCCETGHCWEVTEVYQDDSETLAVVRKCFECDLEFTEYEKIEEKES